MCAYACLPAHVTLKAVVCSCARVYLCVLVCTCVCSCVPVCAHARAHPPCQARLDGPVPQQQRRQLPAGGLWRLLLGTRGTSGSRDLPAGGCRRQCCATASMCVRSCACAHVCSRARTGVLVNACVCVCLLAVPHCSRHAGGEILAYQVGKVCCSTHSKRERSKRGCAITWVDSGPCRSHSGTNVKFETCHRSHAGPCG